MFYGLASNEAFFKERINLFVALAPVVRLDNSQLCHNLNVLTRFDRMLEDKLSSLGIYELFGKGWEIEFEKISASVPGLSGMRKYEKQILGSENNERQKVFEGHFPHGSSVRAVMHYS